MREPTSQPGERYDLGREEALWAEIIRCELGSWRPTELPARFRPGLHRQRSPLWAGMPLAVAACLLVLTVVTLASLSGDVGVVLGNLAGIRLPSTSGSPGGGPAATGHGQRPAAGSSATASPARGGSPASPPSPHIVRVGTASEPRTTAPSPSAGGLAPLPSPPHSPIPAPPAPTVRPLVTPPALPGEPLDGPSAGSPPIMAQIPAPSPG